MYNSDISNPHDAVLWENILGALTVGDVVIIFMYLWLFSNVDCKVEEVQQAPLENVSAACSCSLYLNRQLLDNCTVLYCTVLYSTVLYCIKTLTETGKWCRPLSDAPHRKQLTPHIFQFLWQIQAATAERSDLLLSPGLELQSSQSDRAGQTSRPAHLLQFRGEVGQFVGQFLHLLLDFLFSGWQFAQTFFYHLLIVLQSLL